MLLVADMAGAFSCGAIFRRRGAELEESCKIGTTNGPAVNRVLRTNLLYWFEVLGCTHARFGISAAAAIEARLRMDNVSRLKIVRPGAGRSPTTTKVERADIDGGS